MDCRFANIDGTRCLVNFKDVDGIVTMRVQRMFEGSETIEVNSVQVSDLDGGTMIVNHEICLQMSVEDVALVYTKFHIVRLQQPKR